MGKGVHRPNLQEVTYERDCFVIRSRALEMQVCMSLLYSFRYFDIMMLNVPLSQDGWFSINL